MAANKSFSTTYLGTLLNCLSPIQRDPGAAGSVVYLEIGHHAHEAFVLMILVMAMEQ